MEIRLLDERGLWDSWVEGCPVGNILQSYEWGEFKASFGWKAIRVGVTDNRKIRAGAQLLLRHSPVGTVAYCPRGPLVDYSDARLVDKVFEALHEVARSEGAVFLKIEPPIGDSPGFEDALKRRGFHRSEAIQPRSTIVIDLSPDLATISARLNIKTRYNAGLAGRRNVIVSEGTDEDIPAFYDLLHDTSQRAEFMIHTGEYYKRVWRYLKPRRMAHLLLASYEGEVIAGTMLFVTGSQAYYMYGASNGRHRNLKPNDFVQWESIKWAKSIGCTSYDMWGIPDDVGRRAQNVDSHNGNGYNGSGHNGTEKADATSSPLWGVYLFKKGFGGEVVRFTGAYDYVYSPVQYWLWTKALPFQRHLFGKVRKLQPAKAG
ncbi:MAG: peptidoglycan bridge formation glycyltransferase FemA/FemB family protein [Chloroflexi bacterium]|nr:peptidoglycan bridge formation glycyltransferase FemA/FemB family protein [Chloroflexota bacterium]MDA8187245.1 peptidoglycan bridge formation glycyltransferase FemA/FemB family protein [Dehalococcoidales bacterium]